jgi:hypothetical protein
MVLLTELDACCFPKWVNKILQGEHKDDQKKSLIRRLYTLIHAKKHSEDEIVKKLYGPKATPSHGSFRTLKTRLRHVLIEAYIMQELGAPSYKTYDLALQNGLRQLEIVRMLVIDQAYNAAKEIAIQAFKYVKKYEIITLNHGLTDIISALHLGLFYDEKRYLYYSDLYRYYSQASYDLSTVTNYYREIRNAMYAQRKSPMEIGEKAAEYTEASSAIRQKYLHVSQILTMITRTEVTGCRLRGDYQKAIDASIRGSNALKKCTGTGKSSIENLAISRVECTIMLNDFELSKKQIYLANKEIQKNSVNHLALSSLAILAGLRTSNYEFAYRQFASISQRQINKLLTPPSQEHWTMLEACINLLIISGEISPKEDWPKISNFRVARFLNEVTTSARNKRGDNIQILIIQALFSILRKKYDDAIDRTAGLEAYCNRYLKDDENIRNSCFFKLLLITIKSGFNRRLAQRKGESTYQLMKAANERSKLNNIELIPYEKLWSILLSHLNVTKSDRIAIEKEQKNLIRTN